MRRRSSFQGNGGSTFPSLPKMAHVASKVGHVGSGIRKLQHRLTHKVRSSPGAEALEIFVRRNDRQLFNDVPVQMIFLNFLTGDKIEWYRVQIGAQQHQCRTIVVVAENEWERVTGV